MTNSIYWYGAVALGAIAGGAFWAATVLLAFTLASTWAFPTTMTVIFIASVATIATGMLIYRKSRTVHRRTLRDA